ncbi:MAG: hypothetical protein WA152_02990 [Microgenomates group bacterium]|jgi:hypothetical protein
MSLREQIQSLIKPREIKQAEHLAKVDEALKQERTVTAEYLQGKISLDEYNLRLEETRPLTKIDLRKLASSIGIQN